MDQPYLLDLDGTLMPSHAVDNECYWQAVGAVFGVDTGTLDLTGFRNITDDGILAEWTERTLGRPASPEEVETVRSEFLRRIEGAANDSPSAFAAFPGVRHWLAERPAGSVAVATGGWGHTARFKLGAAGLAEFDLPLASSDDAPTRTGIMRSARERLASPWREQTPVYLGDGTWDFEATRHLGWHFIGVAHGDRAERLRHAGAERVIEDFRALLDPT